MDTISNICTTWYQPQRVKPYQNMITDEWVYEKRVGIPKTVIVNCDYLVRHVQFTDTLAISRRVGTRKVYKLFIIFCHLGDMYK